MRRKELYSLPTMELPPNYTLRHFIPGDEAAWERIIEDSFQWKMSFDDSIRSDKLFKDENVLFICYDNIPVATATAQYIPEEYGVNTGYVHMVGVHSSQKRKSLGFLVSLAVLHHMFKEGRQDAVLQTDDFRIPAIKTYLNLGFIPEFIHENQEQRWADIYKELGIKR
jgi:mycothiol synthase